MSKEWRVRIHPSHWETLSKHLFPGDEDEHGGVIAAQDFSSPNGRFLLVRDVFLASDSDYVPSPRGYRMLRSEFVRDKAMICAEQKLVYLAVHCHGGHNTVSFSPTDLQSHERGYPALLQMSGKPVGALVFASNAVAGDIWSDDGKRFVVDDLTVVGKSMHRLRPSPIAYAKTQNSHHRQSLMLGDDGLSILRSLKVGIIGAGGVGSLLVEYLSRLGVGHLLVVDPDRIEESNFSRIVGSRTSDFHPWFWRKALPKVDIAERVAREAAPHIRFEKIFDDFRAPEVARRFTDCDYLFLAADPMSVRLLFNQIVHQYLISGIVVGSKATVDSVDGSLNQVFSSVRMIGPNGGCLWCNGWITPDGLNREAAEPERRKHMGYLDDPTVPAPSVITLNASGAGYASNLFLFSVTGLGSETDTDFITFDALNGEIRQGRKRHDAACTQCLGRIGAGNSLPLTTIYR